jgi:hypothetical protein
MIDLLPKVLKSLEDVGQKESFLTFMGLIESGTFPLHNICYLLFLDIVEWFSCDSTTHMFHRSQSHFLHFGYFSEFEKDSYRSSPLLEYSASFFWIPYQVPEHFRYITYATFSS